MFKNDVTKNKEECAKKNKMYSCSKPLLRKKSGIRKRYKDIFLFLDIQKN